MFWDKFVLAFIFAHVNELQMSDDRYVKLATTWVKTNYVTEWDGYG